MLATQGAAHKSVLVASAMQSEGKTFTAIALARAAARSGRNVLIVDCNMMQPAATKIAGYLPKAGLAEILRGEIEPAQTVIPTSMPGLSLIGAGCLNDSDPTLLLMEGQLPSLLKWAECYDLVFLDGPAATSLPDTGILAQHCDGVLWCVKWGHTPVAAVVGALDELTRQRAKVLGLVVTMAVPGELRLYERGRFSSTSYPGGA
jgi:Mrp family chromosome partitioning ATPase